MADNHQKSKATQPIGKHYPTVVYGFNGCPEIRLNEYAGQFYAALWTQFAESLDERSFKWKRQLTFKGGKRYDFLGLDLSLIHI